MGRRRFTAEFKREAVKLALQPGTAVTKIAQDLGLPPNMLRNWVKQFSSGKWEAKAGVALKGEQQAELERLRRELAKRPGRAHCLPPWGARRRGGQSRYSRLVPSPRSSFHSYVPYIAAP